MKRGAFTLIELVTTLVLSGILVCLITCIMVANVKLSDRVQTSAEATREGMIALNHMTKVLRFAEPDTLDTNSSANPEYLFIGVEPGHIGLIPSNCLSIKYSRYKADTEQYKANEFYFSTFSDSAGSNLISSEKVGDDITYIDLTKDDPDPSKNIWSSSAKELTIRIKAEKNGAVIPLQTKIKVLPD